MNDSTAFMYTANELFDWLCGEPDFVLLDVRNEKDFDNFAIEGPHLLPYINIPYYDFIEDVDGGISLVPPGRKIRIVCAKEGSAKFVADQLTEHGFTDVGYLEGGIVSWGNMLAAKQVIAVDGFELYQMIRPGKASCSYVLINGKEAALFDPSRSVEVYHDFVASKGATIVKTFETHRQADYISGSPQAQKEFGAEIIASGIDFKAAGFPFTPATDQAIFHLADGPEIKAIHTPGHTLGSTCYLIAGDTIFMATLAEVKKNNVAFHFVHERMFAQYVKDNLRPQPAVYGDIRKINGGWLEVSEDEQNEMDLGKNECGASNYGKVGVSAMRES